MQCSRGPETVNRDSEWVRLQFKNSKNDVPRVIFTKRFPQKRSLSLFCDKNSLNPSLYIKKNWYANGQGREQSQTII